MTSLRRLRSHADRALAVLLTVLGALVLVLGFFGVSDAALAAEQLPYIVSGGLGGIFLMGVGASLWLSADLRDEWRKLDQIESVLEQGLDLVGLTRTEEGAPALRPLIDHTVTDALAGGLAAKPERPARARPIAASPNGKQGAKVAR